MSRSDRIPTPWKYRWRRFRRGTLPVCCFVLCVGLVARFWTRQAQFPSALGEVEAVRIDVAVARDGVLLPLPRGPWTLFDAVEANQIVARLDDRPVRLLLATAQEELQRLRRELEAATAEFRADESDRQRAYLSDAARLRSDLEQRRLAVLDRRVEVELARLESQRCDQRLELLKPLNAKKMVSELELASEQSLREQAVRRVEEGEKALREAESLQAEAESRWQGFPEFHASEAEGALAPIAAAVQVQQARVEEIREDIERLVIRVPIRGTICAVHRWPGESIRTGDPVVTVAADHGRYIVSYLRQDQKIAPAPGMIVDVRARTPGSLVLATSVERVGPQIELIPQHQCRDSRVPEWGVPLRIAIPSGLAVRPGELVDLRLRPGAVQPN